VEYRASSIVDHQLSLGGRLSRRQAPAQHVATEGGAAPTGFSMLLTTMTATDTISLAFHDS
jgi:hypothetical protein